MSAYTDQYDSDFASDPAAASFYTSYALFKQAVVALWTEGALVLADGSSTADQKNVAGAVMAQPIYYARALMPGFLADPTVQANTATATDAQMQAAAHWILPVLSL